MPQLTLRWVHSHDNNVCPICRELGDSNYTWVFNNEPMPNELFHPKHGIVWNVATGSAAHEHGIKGACRCHLDIQFDLADLLEEAKKLRDSLKAGASAGGFTMGQRELGESEE